MKTKRKQYVKMNPDLSRERKIRQYAIMFGLPALLSFGSAFVPKLINVVAFAGMIYLVLFIAAHQLIQMDVERGIKWPRPKYSMRIPNSIQVVIHGLPILACVLHGGIFFLFGFVWAAASVLLYVIKQDLEDNMVDDLDAYYKGEE